MKRNIKLIASSAVLISACLFLTSNTASAHSGKYINKNQNNSIRLKKIKRKYEKLVVGEKNIASAMTEIGKEQIKNSSSAASIFTILKLTPSVNAYQQNVGPSVPVLTVRGVRLSQLSQTLDGVPITSLLSGGEGAFLTNNLGSVVTTGQLQGIHVYPGVAPPDRAGFATVGGTVNYYTKKPGKLFYGKVFGKIGSFNTNTYGMELNTGKIKDADGLRVLVRLSQTTTAGYIQHTPVRYSDFMFSAYKPYDYGLSHISAVVIYNQTNGRFNSAPLPISLLNENGIFYNYPESETGTLQNTKYLTAILGDSNYINRHLVVGIKAFYIGKSSKFETYTNPSFITKSYPYQVNFQSPYYPYGPLGNGNGNPSNDFSYNPVAVFGSYTAGEAAEISPSSSQTLGIVPRVNIFLPHNDITIGGLIASENDSGSSYAYGNLNMPTINGYNSISFGSTGHRVVYSGYLQDKIILFNKHLRIQPGVTLTGVYSRQSVPENIYNSPDHPYSLTNYDKAVLPYLGVSYDLNKNYIIYASYGKGARFAPVQDYVLGTGGSTTVAPGPENVNAYEVGARYVSKRLYFNVDAFLQDMKGMFSFYTNYATGFSQYANIGKEQMKGVELAGKYLLTRNWNISGNASYTDARYLNSFGALVTPFEGLYGQVNAGQPLAFVPNWLFNLGATYHVGNFRATLSESYTGPQPTASEESDTIADPALVFPNTLTKLDPYFLSDLNASYKIPVNSDHIEDLRVSLNINNLLNNHYYQHYYKIYKQFGTYDDGAEYASAYAGMPRFIEVGLSGKFY